jgi:DnaJ-class molecular chaperone
MSGGFEDLFSQFFGGGRGHAKKQKRQIKPTVIEESVTLKQAYDGCTLKCKVKRQKLCEGCDGKGGSDVNNCDKCKGTGVVTKMV